MGRKIVARDGVAGLWQGWTVFFSVSSAHDVFRNAVSNGECLLVKRNSFFVERYQKKIFFSILIPSLSERIQSVVNRALGK